MNLPTSELKMKQSDRRWVGMAKEQLCNYMLLVCYAGEIAEANI